MANEKLATLFEEEQSKNFSFQKNPYIFSQEKTHYHITQKC